MNAIGFKDYKVVNLDNVANIYIDSQNTTQKKIIFNLGYSVKLFNNKFTPDYVYWYYNSMDEFQAIVTMLKAKTLTWIKPAEEGQRYTNPKFVSNFTYEADRQRVIFNLNYNVTHPRDINKLTSDFVFYDFDDSTKYIDFVSELTSHVEYAYSTKSIEKDN